MSKYTEWCEGLERELAAPFPREVHQQKDRKGTFVSTRHYITRLNGLVGIGGWSMERIVAFHSGGKLGLAVGVTVLGVTKWNVGDELEDHGEPGEDGKVRDFGSSSTNSWAQGFKRCMAYGFGMGLYLYDKDWTREYLAGRTGQMTGEQAAMIEELIQSRGVPDDEAQRIAQWVAAGQTEAKAQELIDKLKKRPMVAGSTT